MLDFTGTVDLYCGVGLLLLLLWMMAMVMTVTRILIDVERSCFKNLHGVIVLLDVRSNGKTELRIWFHPIFVSIICDGKERKNGK